MQVTKLYGWKSQILKLESNFKGLRWITAKLNYTRVSMGSKVTAVSWGVKEGADILARSTSREGTAEGSGISQKLLIVGAASVAPVVAQGQRIRAASRNRG